MVVNLQTGKVIFQRNPGLALKPASNEKLAVTLAALEELGPRFRIPTRIYGEGHQDGDVWRGRLVIKGYGDPTLARHDLRNLAREIKSRGINWVTGGVIADETFFDTRRMGPGWKPSYYKEECPPLSALIVGRAKRDGVIVSDPALMTAKAFRTALEGAGVHVVRGVAKAAVKPTAARLADVYSPRVMVLVRLMNLESDNFIAEMLLKEVGARAGSKGSTAAGAFVARQVLKGRSVPLAGVRIADGSGLSRLDRWTARGLTALLRSAWSDARISSIFFNSLPVAGNSGTLADRMESAPARGAVHAKTGTTNAASALSGYVKQRFAFSIIQNGSPVPAAAARRSQDRFAQILAGAAG
jgi:D-alanyl-D-alanine carboxypeptidase/D-alanyl-D-alanine-endopeptidase (penicillin-binding protein 4)